MAFKSLKKASLVITVSLLFLWGCESSRYEKLEGATQGTRYHITAELPEGLAVEELEQRVVVSLAQVDKSLSTYRDDSEIARFNKAAVGMKMKVSPLFIDVLEISRLVHRESGGVFDPTIKPLIELWGFGSKVSLQNFQAIPEQEKIAAAMGMLRFGAVVNEGSEIRKESEITLDFNGVAQGYTVDVLEKDLRSMGINNFMIEVGGELATSGRNPRGERWSIGIVMPESGRDTVENAFKPMLLNEAHVSTSGDYRNYYEIDGKRYSHTIDPRNGMPVSHKLASVTVIAASAGLADAWSTALMVLGEEAGFALAEKQGLPAYFIYRAGEEFAIRYTPAMQKYLAR